MAFPFNGGETHINELELRACFASIRWRSRSAKHIGTKFLHLLDSAVTIGVLAKHRSSSHLLHRVVRRCDALELAASLRPVYAYIKSDDNPADTPSRKRWSVRKTIRKE